MKHSWVIPTDRVINVDTEAIQRNLLSTELPSCPEFREVDYDTAGDEEVVIRPAIQGVISVIDALEVKVEKERLI